MLLLCACSALEARGDLPRLDSAIRKALDGGVTINELKDAFSQLYAYTGFPRSLNALGVYYMKSHLFGDIYASDQFTPAERELITVAALSAMNGVEPQFEGHKECAVNSARYSFLTYSMSCRKMGFCKRSSAFPVITSCFLARVIATFSLRSMSIPSSSKQLAVRKLSW